MFHKSSKSEKSGVEVYNRLGKAVLEIDGHVLPLTPLDARALADRLRAAADTAELTPDDGALWQTAEE